MQKNTSNIITAAILVSGISLLLSGSAQRLEGSISGQGSVITYATQGTSMLPFDFAHGLKPAAFQYGVVESIGTELATGMLLVLLGLAVHVFFIIRKQPLAERGTVHVVEMLRISVLRNHSRPRRRR